MPNPENLIGKEFKPGESGNPAGRPVGSKNRSTIARKVLEMRGLLSKEKMDNLKTKFPDITDQMSVEEIMTIVMADGAISGDDKAYKAVMDSAYGAPKQEVDANVQQTIIPLINLDPLAHVDNNDRTQENISTSEAD